MKKIWVVYDTDSDSYGDCYCRNLVSVCLTKELAESYIQNNKRINYYTKYEYNPYEIKEFVIAESAEELKDKKCYQVRLLLNGIENEKRRIEFVSKFPNHLENDFKITGSDKKGNRGINVISYDSYEHALKKGRQWLIANKYKLDDSAYQICESCREPSLNLKYMYGSNECYDCIAEAGDDYK